MGENNVAPSENRMAIDDHATSTSVLVAETYHSLIELRRLQDRFVIVKTFRNQANLRTASTFRHEVKALEVAADHNHITQLLDADTSRLTLTLRREPGQSLDKYVDDHSISTLPPSDSHTLWQQISSALAYLHTQSLVHDDVKPDNIMWDGATQHSVLIDFGAALNYQELPVDYFNSSGTPPYAPPEYIQRKKGSPGDVWALGVTMLFAFKYVKLPDGKWILPHVFEQLPVLEEMKGWISEIQEWRIKLALGAHSLLADMLDQNPGRRITAAELERQLGMRGSEVKNEDLIPNLEK